MIALEYTAYASPLKKKHPIEKMMYAFIPLILNIILQNSLTSLFIFGVMVFMTLVYGKVSSVFYLKLLSIPFGFLLSSVIVILCTIAFQPLHRALVQFSIGPFYIGIFEESIKSAVTLFVVSLSSVSCLYFLLLTTTIQSFLYGLKVCKTPDILLDLIALTYRFIFVFLETSKTIFLAQQSRLANRTFVGFIKSLALLVSALFVKVIHDSKELQFSMDARSVSEYHVIFSEQYIYERSSVVIVLLLTGSIVLFHLFLGSVVK